jgi:hypothetical protein
MTTHASPVPGWYADPAAPGMLRWWDGRQWTAAQQPLVHALRPPPSPAQGPPRHTGRNERLGRAALLLVAAAQVLMAGALGYLLWVVVNDFVPWYEDAQATPPGEVPSAPPGSVVLSLMPLALLSTLGLGPTIMLIVWTHRCATAAAALKIPARLEPMWAAVGWIVPVLSYWYPYLSIRDCLPPDHPERRTVGRWWAVYLVSAHAGLVAAAFALVGIVPFVVAWVVQAGLAVAGAMLGLRVVRAIDEAHREALEPSKD